MNKQQKIGACGICCSQCFLFKEQKCPGCQPNEVCPLPECARQKEIDFCFSCSSFPCQLHYEKGPFVKALLDYFKKQKQA